MQHKKIAVITFLFLCCFLIKPAFSEPVELLDKAVTQEEVLNENTQDYVTKTTPKTADIINQSASWPYQNDLQDTVAPKPRQELFRVLGYFLKVMFYVAICSIIIFILALFAKRFYGIPNTGESRDNQDTLKAPSSENEALKNFLNKTR